MSSTLYLPSRNDPSAPHFNGNPCSLIAYLDEVESLAHQVSLSPRETIKVAIRYTHSDTYELWNSLDNARSDNWPAFKAELVTFYPEITQQRRYSILHLETLVEQQRSSAITHQEAFGDYYRRFRTVSNYLYDKGTISNREISAYFISGLHPRFRSLVRHQLCLENPRHHPDDPYNLDQIYDASVFILSGFDSCSSDLIASQVITPSHGINTTSLTPQIRPQLATEHIGLPPVHLPHSYIAYIPPKTTSSICHNDADSFQSTNSTSRSSPYSSLIPAARSSVHPSETQIDMKMSNPSAYLPQERTKHKTHLVATTTSLIQNQDDTLISSIVTPNIDSMDDSFDDEDISLTPADVLALPADVCGQILSIILSRSTEPLETNESSLGTNPHAYPIDPSPTSTPHSSEFTQNKVDIELSRPPYSNVSVVTDPIVYSESSCTDCYSILPNDVSLADTFMASSFPDDFSSKTPPPLPDIETVYVLMTENQSGSLKTSLPVSESLIHINTLSNDTAPTSAHHNNDVLTSNSKLSSTFLELEPEHSSDSPLPTSIPERRSSISVTAQIVSNASFNPAAHPFAEDVDLMLSTELIPNSSEDQLSLIPETAGVVHNSFIDPKTPGGTVILTHHTPLIRRGA